jgi:hypothetical protein
LLTGCSAAALASCGGDDEPTAVPPLPPPPTIASNVAAPLADRSDKVATLLRAGDACGARSEAAALRGDLTKAINDGAIPELYLEDLSALVNEIQAQLPPCRRASPNDDVGEHGGKKDKKDKQHGKHHEGDD